MAGIPSELVDLLAAARRRGESFEVAWQGALCVVLDQAESAVERECWAVALRGTREAWRRSYHRAPPTEMDRVLADLLDDTRVPVADRECARCRREIPAARGPLAIYCGGKCRNLAYSDRHPPGWQLAA